MSESKNLHQRLQEVAKEVGAIKATGKNRFGAKALSIEDMEDAIREQFARVGIISDYSFGSVPMGIDGALRREGQGKDELWIADIAIRLVNADDPNDYKMARSIDVGGNPSAAVSFALKRYYKALFHVADEDDEGGKSVGSDAKSTPKAAPKSTPKPNESTPKAKPAGELTEDQRADIRFLNDTLDADKKRSGKELHASLEAHGAKALIEILAGDHLAQHGKECPHYSDGSDGAIVVKRG